MKNYHKTQRLLENALELLNKGDCDILDVNYFVARAYLSHCNDFKYQLPEINKKIVQVGRLH